LVPFDAMEMTMIDPNEQTETPAADNDDAIEEESGAGYGNNAGVQGEKEQPDRS
jgi:hypothetical protein